MSASTELTSIHEMRRRAPLHYMAKADNARFSAYTLSHRLGEAMKDAAVTCGYSGDPHTSLHEGFRRESAIALELAIKAVIAVRIERKVARAGVTRVRPTHDLVSLWRDADLPELSEDDQHRLLIAKRILYWAGRYAAPKEDKDIEREEAEIAKVGRKGRRGRGLITQAITFGWCDFDRLYGIAAQAFWLIKTDGR